MDADICSGASEKELLEIFECIYRKFGKRAFAVQARNREIEGAIPFYLYRISAPSITEAERTRAFLLDIMGAKPKYATAQLSLKTSFF